MRQKQSRQNRKKNSSKSKNRNNNTNQYVSGRGKNVRRRDDNKGVSVLQDFTNTPGAGDDSRSVKRTVKDSVFTNMLRDKKYLLQLYQALHPEDTEATEESLTNVTINNVLVNGQYNDVGFLANNKLMILVEEQSSVWTSNIIVRALFYIDQTMQNYLNQNGADLYGSKKVELPETELYVLYVGDRVTRPDEITLKEEFYKNRKSAIDVRVKMIYGTVHPEKMDGEDIIGQYVQFTKVYDEQVQLYDRTPKAVSETIRICVERGVLREYLESREQEVVTMMMDLYDQDRILKTHIESEKRIAAKEAAKEVTKEATEKAERELETIIERMLRDGELSVEKIASYLGVSERKVHEIEAAMLQQA
ncbi:MAG: hypothetical protein LUI13_10485 [Lachnospiraceae bacterium]|nr:hypothetical protein [Lachnospiraceae bacterium]